jgi:RNA recognition motif-containing protein
MNIFVKNLSEEINGESLRGIFSRFGEVYSAKVVYDRVTSESRGFGFVEMETEEAGRKAIEALNGTEHRGKELEVKEADDRGKKNDAGGRW